MTQDPFIPIARPINGRKTQPGLFGKPEVPFPLATRAQKRGYLLAVVARRVARAWGLL